MASIAFLQALFKHDCHQVQVYLAKVAAIMSAVLFVLTILPNAIADDTVYDAIGDTWEYSVSYDGKTSRWLSRLLSIENWGSELCLKIETVPDREIKRYLFDVDRVSIIKNKVDYRSVTGKHILSAQHQTKTMGYNINGTQNHEYSGYSNQGYPFEPGERWSYLQHIEANLVGAVWDNNYDVRVADTLESVEVPAGEFDCFKVVHTEKSDPSRVVIEWWDAEGRFVIAPVKIVDSAFYDDIQYMELESYPVPPLATTIEAGEVTADNAILNGNLERLGEDGKPVRVYFEWGTENPNENATEISVVEESGTFQADITGLLPDTSYRYRVKTLGGLATTYGDQYSNEVVFTTGSNTSGVVMEINTGKPCQITDQSVVLNASLQQLGNMSVVDAAFEWGIDETYGNEAYAGILSGTGSFSVEINGLEPETVYHCRARVGGNNPVYSEDQKFETKSVYVFPTVSTGSYTTIGTDSAVLDGRLESMGSASEVEVYLEWGIDENYGNETYAGVLSGTGSFSVEITNLEPEKEYYYRAAVVGISNVTGTGKRLKESGRVCPEPISESD